jgi:hypothetical protein
MVLSFSQGGVLPRKVFNEVALHRTPFDNSQFHKIWISVIYFVLGKFGSLYVILLNTCWRAMGRHGTMKMTVAYERHGTGNGPCVVSWAAALAHSTAARRSARVLGRHGTMAI